MLIFMDSFDHYMDITSKWTSGSNSLNGSYPVISTVGRFGTNGLRLQAGFSAPHAPSAINKSLPGVFTSLIFGGAIKFNSWTSGNIDEYLLAFMYNGTTQTSLTANWSTGRAQVVRPNGTDLVNYYFSALQTYYIEFKIVIHSTNGSWELRINEELVGSNSGVNTGASSATNQISLQGTAGFVIDWDDIYILDTTVGSVNTNYLGDVRIEALRPTGNGALSQWDGSDGNNVDNYLLVDETAPNGDTDYVTTLDPGDTDTYLIGNLVSTTGEVRAVQYILNAKKDDAGARIIRPVARIGGNNYPASDSISLGVGYTNHFHIQEVNPATTINWTLDDVNNIEFGVELVS